MHQGILTFAKKHRGHFSGRVLEVGSMNVNGSVRDVMPITVGVDMREGRGVDQVCDASDLLQTFGPESFDGVVSCDMLEHTQDWESALSNIWAVLRTGGPLLLTMANPEKGRHGYPDDYWRWPMERWKRLFAGNDIRASFYQNPSQGVVVFKSEPLDLSHQPDAVA